MPDLRHTVTDQVRQQLIATERSNDRSIAESARLVATMLEGAARLRAAAEVGHEALEEVFAGLSAGVESRRRYVAAHQRLLKVADQIGVPVTDTGGGANKRLTGFIEDHANVVDIGDAAA